MKANKEPSNEDEPAKIKKLHKVELYILELYNEYDQEGLEDILERFCDGALTSIASFETVGYEFYDECILNKVSSTSKDFKEVFASEKKRKEGPDRILMKERE
jgi:hypothetical protein